MGKDSSVIVAFSGGCDSLCLLTLCVRVLGFSRVYPVYVNHNIRCADELDSEMALNRSNCEKLGLSLEICTLENGLVAQTATERKGGIEDAARALRYKVLETARKAHGCSYVLTAHHRQDQIETIIMRLGRGAAFTSLCGIARIDEKRHLMRPLLDFSRKEIENYVASSGLKWSTDSTNADSAYLRNHIRNDIVPNLKTIMPDYEKMLLDLGNKASLMRSKRLPCETVIALSHFDGLGPTETSEILFSLWDRLFPGSDMPQALVNRVLRAIHDGKDCRIGSNGAIFCIYHGSLYLVDPNRDEDFRSFEMPINVQEDLCITLPGGMVLRSGCHAKEIIGDPASGIEVSRVLGMESGKFRGKCSVRFARIGDQIQLKDGTKMVMRLLQDMGIPACLRFRVPVIVDDDGICAVFGRFYGQNDRICVKFRSSLAPNGFTQYIVFKG